LDVLVGIHATGGQPVADPQILVDVGEGGGGTELALLAIGEHLITSALAVRSRPRASFLRVLDTAIPLAWLLS
jgi:hypothetical protein